MTGRFSPAEDPAAIMSDFVGFSRGNRLKPRDTLPISEMRVSGREPDHQETYWRLSWLTLKRSVPAA